MLEITRNWSLLSIYEEERAQRDDVSSSSHEHSTSMVAAVSVSGSGVAKNPNSFTLVSELAELSSPNIRGHSNNLNQNWPNISNSTNTSSTSSPPLPHSSTTSGNASAGSASDCILSPPRLLMNVEVKQLAPPNDANPRKNSPGNY